MDSKSDSIKPFEIKHYLKEARGAYQVYKSNIDEPINVTLGNVSCDMDSAIGAILLGYYLTLKEDYKSQPGNFDLFWVPVINCPRKEIVARLDIVHHLSKYDINHEDLIYIDDLDVNHYANNNLLRLAIVDHNLLDICQQQWGKSIMMIVDHHKDEKAYLDQKHDRTIEFCGSACSLVLGRMFDEGLERFMSKAIVKFFLPAVLIDCENFKPSLEGKKWSQIDKDVIFKVNRFIADEYYSMLINKKTDQELNIKLGLELILRKDYKNYVWKNCVTGISVVFNPIHELLFNFGVDEIKNTLCKRMQDTKLQFYVIISQIYAKDGPQRELMLFDEDVERLTKVGELFEKCCIKSTKKRFTGLKNHFMFFKLADESLSRKKIEPVFRELFEKF